MPNYTARRIIAALILIGAISLVAWWTATAGDCVTIAADYWLPCK